MRAAAVMADRSSSLETRAARERLINCPHHRRSGKDQQQHGHSGHHALPAGLFVPDRKDRGYHDPYPEQANRGASAARQRDHRTCGHDSNGRKVSPAGEKQCERRHHCKMRSEPENIAVPKSATSRQDYRQGTASPQRLLRPKWRCRCQPPGRTARRSARPLPERRQGRRRPPGKTARYRRWPVGAFSATIEDRIKAENKDPQCRS